MLSIYSVRIFKNLVSQGSARSFPKTVIIKTANVRCFSRTITPEFYTNKTKQEENIRKIVKLLNGYPGSESIKWKEVEKQLDLDIEEPRAVILQACLRLNDFDAGMSYFNHVSKSGKDFTPVELIFFLKLFNEKDQIIKYESLIKQVYDKIKQYMSSEVIRKYLMNMMSEIPDFFHVLIENIGEGKKIVTGARGLIVKALKEKNIQAAFELMKSSNMNVNLVFNSYVDYLCDMVMENKFSVDMITNLIKYCEDYNNTISSANYLLFSTNFFNTLKQYEKNYKWTLNECHISDFSICSNCGKKLIDKCISESDFNSLKEAFFPKAGLTKTNIFLNSSDKELQLFFEFLNKTKPYQIVVDSLNLIYRSKRYSSYFSSYVKYFLDKEMDVLIIGRKHIQNAIFRMSFLKKKYYKNRCQFFFTDNLSDDDLFTLYATLHGGLGTYFLSGDFLQCYGSRFDKSLRRIYFKWKSYHHYIFMTNIIPPLPSLGLSQLTSDENGKKLTWHISHNNDTYSSDLLSPSLSLKWACLQAEKKSSNPKRKTS